MLTNETGKINEHVKAVFEKDPVFVLTKLLTPPCIGALLGSKPNVLKISFPSFISLLEIEST